MLTAFHLQRTHFFSSAVYLIVLSMITFGGHKIVHAENEVRMNPKKLTRDLDKKNDALAEEEAKLLSSLGTEESARASIDLVKAADSIVEVDDIKPAQVIVQQKIRPLADPAGITTVVPKAAPPAAIAKKEVVRQIDRESDPALRREVTSMGNLFVQWQHEFEKKHADVLDSQQKMEETFDARLDDLESSENSDDYDKRLILTEKNLLQEERLALLKTQKDFDSRLTSLEKIKIAPYEDLDKQMNNIDKNNKDIHATLLKQDQSLKSLKLVDGQLKHRMLAVENQTGDAVKEINNVKLSVDRIEGSLAELSEQFTDSLKYMPHRIYQASVDADEYPYNWGDPNPRYTKIPHNATMSDMPLVTVTEETANLWSGPGEDDKIVTTIRRGGQLAVEVSERDWYRVILADGRRAWIPARSVIHNNPLQKSGTALRISSVN